MPTFSRKVLVITAGGTIDKVYFDAKSDYEVGESVVDDLLKQAHVYLEYDLVHLLRKDSLELTVDDRSLIKQKIAESSHEAIVVTHGTDTMAETARALATLEGKTIVITGALAPARFAQSDATFNVGMAFAAVQSLPPGVYVVMNGQVFDGLKVRKDRELNRFVSAEEGQSEV